MDYNEFMEMIVLTLKALLSWHPPVSPLNPVDSGPGRHQGEDSGHQVHQVTGCVALVSARLPQLVQACASDHQRWVQFQSIGPKRWVLKEFL